MILRHGEGKVFKHADNLCGRGILRGEAVASANDEGGVFLAVEAFLDVEQQGFAVCPGFFCAVENGDALRCCRHCCQEVLCRERAVEMHGYKTYFLTLFHHGVDGFLGGLGYRTHGDNHAFGIFGTVVVEQAVFAPGDFRNLVHVFLDNGRYIVVGSVACLAVLEEHVAVFGHAARHGCLGRESLLAEACECLTVEQRGELFLLQHLDFLDFVRCAETVEEVYKRYR